MGWPWWGKVTCSKLRGELGVGISENIGEKSTKLQSREASAQRWGLALLKTGPQCTYHRQYHQRAAEQAGPERMRQLDMVVRNKDSGLPTRWLASGPISAT